MGTPKTTPLGRSIDHALSELETATDEIRVKLLAKRFLDPRITSHARPKFLEARHGFVELEDGDAEAFGEEFILAATSAEAVSESARDELSDQELDGLTVEDSPDPSLS